LLLEGLAARSVAERRVDAALARSLEDCLKEGDESTVNITQSWARF
jgi:GntR family transcriptional regulator of vanillate catabolism